MISVHRGVKYLYDQCYSKFTHQDDLKKHKIAIHESKFTRKESLHKHMISVNRGIKYPGDLNRHKMSIHRDLKYPCNQCDSKFTQKSNLNRHKISVHEGVICVHVINVNPNLLVKRASKNMLCQCIKVSNIDAMTFCQALSLSLLLL